MGANTETLEVSLTNSEVSQFKATLIQSEVASKRTRGGSEGDDESSLESSSLTLRVSDRALKRPVVVLIALVCFALLQAQAAFAQTPPVLTTVFPTGGQIGQTVDVAVSGGNLQSLKLLHSNVPGLKTEKLDASRFRLSIPADVMPGLYDLWAIGDNGVSAPRTLAISNRAEQIEVEPNDTSVTPMSMKLDTVTHGRIEKANDVDHYRFEAKRSQRVVIECWAERIDSRLRAVIEIYDSTGKRLAVNRGYFGSDPLIDFRVPADGAYVVKVQDLISSGSAEHYYRLDIDTGPRVAFTMPNVIERGTAGRVTLFGWNLPGSSGRSEQDQSALDRIDVEIPAAQARDVWPLPVRLQPAQAVLAGAAFPFHLSGSHAPVVIGLSDVPVTIDQGRNVSAATAQEISVPCEVSGQLVSSDERDWFAFYARRGEVIFMEALGQRLQSPVDLQISLMDEQSKPLAQFTDEARNIGGSFPTAHLDPSGRWVCPADGRYLIAIRNLIGGQQNDPRRVYRLSVRREEPDFELVAVPHRPDAAGLNVKRGGRELLDVLAFRRRGMNDAIRVAAQDLPPGVECPDVWLGPGVDRATIVVSADRNVVAGLGELKLVGSVGSESHRVPVRGGTIVRTGTPSGWGRITSQIPIAIAGDSPLSITVDAHEELTHQIYGKLRVKHSPGGVVDVAVHVERKDAGHQAPLKLIGVGLPDSIQNQTGTIPAGQQKGYISFFLPPTLPLGRYSFVVQAETTVPVANQKTETIIVHSNPIVFEVQSAAFNVEVDPFAVTRAKRGETIRVSYSAQRLNGFIGKMHTELAAPGRVTDIIGIRGRGETFTGQTDKGTLQIQINDDAPLGRQSFLRLFTVGVVEDEALYFGSSLLPLEIVE